MDKVPKYAFEVTTYADVRWKITVDILFQAVLILLRMKVMS